MLLGTFAIMGGTFDPIHNGHLFIADMVKMQCKLDRIVFIPAGDPPHKNKLAPARHRLNMVQQVAPLHNFGVSDLEVKRRGTTYTIDTLTELKMHYPSEDIHYIVGTDTLLVIESWRLFSSVAKILKGLIVIPRPGVDCLKVTRHAEYLRKKYDIEVRLLTHRGPNISSTDVRESVCRGEPVDALVPRPVMEYIALHGLYLEPIRERLAQTLSKARYSHTLGVENTAAQLAKRFDADIGKARIAALLHDCAKDLSWDDMYAAVCESGIAMDETERLSKQLLHAAAGVAIARRVYDVKDPEILSAIRWHTVGHGGMTKLEKIIYLADAIEPMRRNYPGLQSIRETAKANLNEAVRLCAEHTYNYVRRRGLEPNTHTEDLLNEYRK